MTCPLEQADRLKELARRLDSGEHLGELGPWAATAIGTYLGNARRGMTLEQAFSLDRGRGELPWWRIVEISERNEAIRELARRHFGDLTLRAAAQKIVSEATRYESGRWRYERHANETPPHARGTARELLWRALRAAGGRFPKTARQLENILARADSDARGN